MPYFANKDIEIKGICSAVPKNASAILDTEKTFDRETLERFIKYTGIQTRRLAGEKQTASDLSCCAAEYLLREFQIDRSQIGVLLFCSQEPDYFKPATAYILQKRLGISNNCAALDVNLGCSGFVYGNQLIQTLLSAGNCRYGLLLLGETPNKLIDPLDKSMGLMFSDAGAAILYEKTGRGNSCTLLMADGRRFSSIMVPSGGFRDPHPEEKYYVANDGKLHSKYTTYMDGLEVFAFSITTVVRAIKDYLQHVGKHVDDFDYLVLHQTNLEMLNRISDRLGFPRDKVLISLDKYGNTSGASIPVTISEILHGSQLKTIRILAAGFGIGLSWGVTELTLHGGTVLPVVETDEYYKEGIIV